MKNTLFIRLIIFLGLLLPDISQAEFLDLATMPLQTSGTADAKPNLMFVLDNSTSMSWSYAPDWVNDSTTAYWSRYNSDFNTQYYDPEVLYSPPLNYLGVSMGNQTKFSAVANEVDDLGAIKNSTSDLRSNAFYYSYVPGEYCNNPNLVNCIISKVATGSYIYPADIRWCSNSTAATRRTYTSSATQRCQKINVENPTYNDGNRYTNLRRPMATYRLTLTKTSTTVSIQSIKINNMEILSTQVSINSFGSSATTLATAVVSNICKNATTPSGNCDLAGNTASNNNGTSNIVTIRTPAGEALNPASPIQISMTGGTFIAQPTLDTTNDIPGSLVYVPISGSATTYAAPGKSRKGDDRADCVGDVCTYNEEMINFSNWWAYYRTRMQSMKTAASQAFKSLDSRYRVGLYTINPTSNYLAIADFDTTQKQLWYKNLFAVTPNGGGTPLRSALSNVGRYFAGKGIQGKNDDPMQYACQPNFTLLTTDGYWGTDTPVPTKINNTAIGDQDSGSTPRPQQDFLRKSNTLADAAKYYYDTDIRDGSFSNCGGAFGNSVCGTADDYPKQNMVTMALGLGIDGTLIYTDDYENQKVGDFNDLITGAKKWPDPTESVDGSRIDDLWHSAVNGGGIYYSASNPKLLRESLAKGLAEIKSLPGASAAAAASSLAPTNADNSQYVASYQTVKWTGNLEARKVNVDTLVTSETATWCVESIAAQSCPSNATQYTGPDGRLYCKTTSSNQSDCANANLGSTLGFSESASCYVEVSKSCTGRLQVQVASSSGRTIFFNSNNTLMRFTADNLPVAHRDALTKGYDTLSQMQGLLDTDPKMKDPDKVGKLVDYLRGNKTYEDISSNTKSENRLFRERQATLGDISQSRPAYFKVSNAGYLDANHKSYKEKMALLRTPAVYVGANDGMLHAFNASTGDELWAFIPTPVIPNLANLADKEYGANYHTNYVNGSPVVADICISGCNGTGAVWRTILVSGLNGGGRGYFAIDVTTPEEPVLLWEFGTQSSVDSKNLGYTFGNPVVTKMKDGRWVVLVTSGYNNGSDAKKLNSTTFIKNSPAGDGAGHLYVLDANTGAQVGHISTGNGSTTDPSGLAKISAYAEHMFENNSALRVYGGDLNGNIWRFDINTGAVTKIATLTGSDGNKQKITTQPELGKVDKNMVVLVGTGKFLEPADLTNTPLNSVYVFKDNGQSSAIEGRKLEPRTLSADRKVTSTAEVSFDNSYGWLLDFSPGERVNLDPLLLNGVLLMPTLVPTSQACSGAGYGWFNYFDYKKGRSILPSGIVSERMTSPAVGFNIVYDGKGVPHVVVTGSNDPTPQQLSLDDQVFGISGTGKTGNIFKQKANGSYGTKQSWRELIQ